MYQAFIWPLQCFARWHHAPHEATRDRFDIFLSESGFIAKQVYTYKEFAVVCYTRATWVMIWLLCDIKELKKKFMSPNVIEVKY